VETIPSNFRFSESITIFLYRAVRGFLRQATDEGISSLITVCVDGEPVSIVCMRAAVNGETRSPGAKDAPLVEPMIDMSLAGIQARGKLLGIAVTVEFSPGTRTPLVPMFLC
jgi:hypothetical protein